MYMFHNQLREDVQAKHEFMMRKAADWRRAQTLSKYGYHLSERKRRQPRLLPLALRPMLAAVLHVLTK